jgi:hypothetical protein
MRLALALATLAVALFSAEVRAGEIEVGHLETKDDPDAISSWVFFHCDEDGDLMICDTFQTLISRELPPEQRLATLKNRCKVIP